MDILQDDHLHLELDIFEKDIAAVKVGQKISYTIPALGNREYLGEISVIGKEFDQSSKTIRVHGHLEGEKPTFVKDLYVNAKIWINDETVDALPVDALIHDGIDSFIFVAVDDKEKSETEFKKISVIAGVTEEGFTSVKFIDEIPEGMSVVTKGAYFIYAESMASELEHDH
jgi:cobalt-zinc-cadmium efflux system membrane fusion protein